MKVLALLGCVVLLLFLCLVFVFFATLIIDAQDYDMDGREVAQWILIITFVILISILIVFPEELGYEKVSTVSENIIDNVSFDGE